VALRDIFGRTYKLLGPDHLQLCLLRYLWDQVTVSGHLDTSRMTLVIEEFQFCDLNRIRGHDKFERSALNIYDCRVA
jgi:hypothetical protein